MPSMVADSRSDEAHPDYVTAAEAMRRLSVRRQTLYSYVSRGLIRSVRQPGHKERLYLRDDIERVGARSSARAGHGAAAASAMNLGEPIVSTSVTEITTEGPLYRGHLAVDLACKGYSFEAVCEVLWSGLLPPADFRWPAFALDPREPAIFLMEGCAPNRLIEALAQATLRLDALLEQPASANSEDTLDLARKLIRCLVKSVALWQGPQAINWEGEMSVAAGIAHALVLAPSEVNLGAISRMLAVLADHELAPGTLVARVAASGGSSLHNCIASAICASSGSQVARLYSRIDHMLAQTRTVADLMDQARQLQGEGLIVPGFTHYLYPKGDPRAKCLLAFARDHLLAEPEVVRALNFAEELGTTMGIYPRHEFSVVVLCRALGLVDGMAGAIFVIARVAGWVAHIMEQRKSGVLLRPRARFEADDIPPLADGRPLVV